MWAGTKPKFNIGDLVYNASTKEFGAIVEIEYGFYHHEQGSTNTYFYRVAVGDNRRPGVLEFNLVPAKVAEFNQDLKKVIEE